MPNLLTLIKQAAVDAVAEASPCAVFFGEIKELLPFTVAVDERFEIKEEQLVMPDHIFMPAKGDKLILLRMQGGSRFIAVGRFKE